MALPSRTALELNELRWWSKWATVKRLGRHAYMITSTRFLEPFFNRTCFLDCGAASAYRESAENGFRRLGLPPILTVNCRCSSALGSLVSSGYRELERMTVMVSARRFEQTGAEVEVRRVSEGSVDEWTRAYLLSFYGDTGLAPEVTKVARRATGDRSTTLLEARLDDTTAGVLAVFRSRQEAGIYCVGTIPGFRRRGVAGALLGRACEIAESEGRRAILQTLKSDGAEAFYSKRGFVSLYQKSFMRQES